MSDLFVFLVGVFIFAITVAGTVIGAGISLSSRWASDNPYVRRRPDKYGHYETVPVKVKN